MHELSAQLIVLRIAAALTAAAEAVAAAAAAAAALVIHRQVAFVRTCVHVCVCLRVYSRSCVHARVFACVTTTGVNRWDNHVWSSANGKISESCCCYSC